MFFLSETVQIKSMKDDVISFLPILMINLHNNNNEQDLISPFLISDFSESVSIVFIWARSIALELKERTSTLVSIGLLSDV